MQKSRSTPRAPKSTRTLKTPRVRKPEAEELLVPTDATIKKNVKEGTFFRVRGKKSVKNNLSIGGAKNKFKAEPKFIYVPADLNLAGTEEDVVAVLEKLVPEDEIDEVLRQAITSENYNVPESQGGKKEIFDELVRDYNLKQKGEAERRQEGISASGKPIVTLGMLDYIISNLDNAVETAPSKATTGTPKGPSRTKSAKTAAPSSRVKTLSSKIAALAEGKVLNVSKMDANGVGARVVNTPGPNSTIVGVDLNEIPIVSSTEEGYANALDVLSRETGRDYTPLIEDWREARENVAPRSNRPVSIAAATSSRKKGKALASPRRRTGKTLPSLNESTPPTSPPGVRKLQGMASRTFGSRVTSPPTSPAARRSPSPERIPVEEEAEEERVSPRRSPLAETVRQLTTPPRQATPPRENVAVSPTVARGVGTGRKLKLGGLKLNRNVLNPASAAVEEF
nr:hypothetical protein Clen_524 [Cedratvirus lena]